MNNDICAICQDYYHVNNELITLSCSHSFHENCFEKYLTFAVSKENNSFDQFFENFLNGNKEQIRGLYQNRFYIYTNAKCPYCRHTVDILGINSDKLIAKFSVVKSKAQQELIDICLKHDYTISATYYNNLIERYLKELDEYELVSIKFLFYLIINSPTKINYKNLYTFFSRINPILTTFPIEEGSATDDQLEEVDYFLEIVANVHYIDNYNALVIKFLLPEFKKNSLTLRYFIKSLLYSLYKNSSVSIMAKHVVLLIDSVLTKLCEEASAAAAAKFKKEMYRLILNEVYIYKFFIDTCIVNNYTYILSNLSIKELLYTNYICFTTLLKLQNFSEYRLRNLGSILHFKSNQSINYSPVCDKSSITEKVLDELLHKPGVIVEDYYSNTSHLNCISIIIWYTKDRCDTSTLSNYLSLSSADESSTHLIQTASANLPVLFMYLSKSSPEYIKIVFNYFNKLFSSSSETADYVFYVNALNYIIKYETLDDFSVTILTELLQQFYQKFPDKLNLLCLKYTGSFLMDNRILKKVIEYLFIEVHALHLNSLIGSFISNNSIELLDIFMNFPEETVVLLSKTDIIKKLNDKINVSTEFLRKYAKTKYLPLSSVIFTTIPHLLFVYANTSITNTYLKYLDNPDFSANILPLLKVYDYEGNTVYHSCILRGNVSVYSKLVEKFGKQSIVNLYNKTPEDLLKFF